jgi:hypothetical protein
LCIPDASLTFFAAMLSPLTLALLIAMPSTRNTAEAQASNRD